MNRDSPDEAAIRVLVAEDEEPLRAAICDLIRSENGLELVGIASSADEAIAQAIELKPDVALLDVRMPGGGGPRAAAEIRSASPATRSLALSAYTDKSNVLEMLRAGAIGYLVKGDSPGEIADAVRRAARNQASFSGAIVTELASDLSHDMRQRGEVDEVFRRSEARFRELLASAPDAVVIIDAAGRIVLANDEAERLFGYRREELVGRSTEMLLPPRFRDGRLFVNPAARPMGVDLAFVGLRKDGTEFPIDISVSVLETEEGRLATAFIRDITDRLAAQSVRQKKDERFEALLESAPDAVVIVDANGRIVIVNKQTEKLFGYDRGELLGQSVGILMPQSFRGRHVSHLTGYMADPRTRPLGAGLELAGRRKDGSAFPVDISLSAIDTDEGRLATAFVRDVTERVAQADLERGLVDLERGVVERRTLLARLVSAGEEERRRIAGDIHDDSIQVMTAAGMRVQILRRALVDPDHLALLDELEQTIQLSISRLRHLIFELRPPTLDTEGLSAALRAYLDGAGEETDTSYRFDDRLTAQPSEEARVILYRIAQEILMNVRKHAQAKSATVTLAAQDAGYHVRVTDDGVGFVPDLSSDRPGHLGLAAVRERAGLAGGWLRVDSSPGKGTTVDFWIADTADDLTDERSVGRRTPPASLASG